MFVFSVRPPLCPLRLLVVFFFFSFFCHVCFFGFFLLPHVVRLAALPHAIRRVRDVAAVYIDANNVYAALLELCHTGGDVRWRGLFFIFFSAALFFYFFLACVVFFSASSVHRRMHLARFVVRLTLFG